MKRWGDAGKPLFRVRDALRPPLRFDRNDLTAPAAPVPGAPFDLISCRNVLIYLRREVVQQMQAMRLESLTPGGYLLLGESEGLEGPVGAHFDVIRRQQRLFRRKF